MIVQPAKVLVRSSSLDKKMSTFLSAWSVNNRSRLVLIDNIVHLYFKFVPEMITLTFYLPVLVIGF